MAKNVVEFTLRAKDKATRVIASVAGAAASFTKGLLNQGANIKAWGEMISGTFQNVFGRLWGTIKEAFKFETLTTQFRTLLGSMEAAEARMKMLASVAEETPFDMEGVVKASRTLTVMSRDALGTEWALKLVGDTAAATGGSIEELAMWIGRAYAMIQAGKPFGEAAMRLTELGALTPEVRQKMEKLQAAGATNAEVWDTLVAHLESFQGAMLNLSKTGDGLTSTLEDNWTAAVREFGNAFMASAKDSIQFLINKLAELQASGAITEWANRAVKALEPLRNLIVGILGDDNSRSHAFAAAWSYLKEVFSYGATVLCATGDYIASKLADVALIMRDNLAASAAIAVEKIRYQLKEFWHDINLDNIASSSGYRERKDVHRNTIAGIEASVAQESKRRLKPAEDDFAKAFSGAATRLKEASATMAESLHVAAEEGARAVEMTLSVAQEAKERAADKASRLDAEKRQASTALSAGRSSSAIAMEQRIAMDQRRLEAEQKFQQKVQAYVQKGLGDLRPILDQQIEKAKANQQEAFKRAMDPAYAREQEESERLKAQEQQQFNKRARALLERAGRQVLSENYDLSQLTKRDQRLARAMRAQKEAEKLEALRKKAYEAQQETAANTKELVGKINSLLQMK